MAIQLTPARPADAEKMWRMQVRAFAEMLEKYQDTGTSPACETRERVEEKIRMAGSRYYFIMEDGNAVGGIRVRVLPDGEKRISPLFVLPEYRRRGIARHAMRMAEAIYGPCRWALDTILQEKGNCRLYESMGYRPTGRTERVNDRLTLIEYKK